MPRFLRRRGASPSANGPWARLTRPGPDGERGAVMVLASLATVVAVVFTAFAVDLGQAASTKRSLQTVVDLAALDAVRILGDRAGQGGGLSPQQHAEKMAKESLIRNSFDPTNVALGNTYTVELGEFNATTRVFAPTTNTLVQNAVRVSARTTKDWSFMPGGEEYLASGVASVFDTSAISIGSYLARVDTSVGLMNSLFGSFLGGSVTLVGYTGLASAKVNLLQLTTELGFGTVDELLTTNTTVKNFLNATAAALQKKGDAASLAARTDVLTLAASTNAALNVKLGDLIKVTQGSGTAAATTDLNVLQLIQMAAEVANGTNAVSVTLSNSSLGGLGALLAPSGNILTLKVIEKPQIAIGPARQDANGEWVTWAQTAQIRAQLRLRPLGTVLGGTLDLPIYIEGAAAKASLTGVDCKTPIDDSTVTVHTDTQAVRARVGVASDINASGTVTVNNATILNLAGLVRVTGSADVSVLSSASNPDLAFNGPFDWSQVKSVGTGTSLSVGALLKNKPVSLNVTSLGLILGLGTVAGDVLAVINPILDALDAGLADPLLAMLGVSLGGGDVSVGGPLRCNERTLVN